MSTSIRIVIGALGGEGGGVLGKWIADMAAREGYLSQTTSVPGVAQRTGATIYYIELFPRAESEAAGRLPVMSMFPAPGDVDLVISSEIVEAGRLIQRGFVTPDRTTLVTSTHRTYGITEKEAMGNGIIDKQAIIDVARERAKTFIGFDMLETARRHDSVINAALFGALAETGVLPFSRESFEETIRFGRIAVESNLKTFAASYALAAQQQGGVQIVDPAAADVSADAGTDDLAIADPAVPAAETGQPFQLPEGTTDGGREVIARISTFPPSCQELLYLGAVKLAHYQDHPYAHEYLDRVQAVVALEPEGSDQLTLAVARYLALWMAFEDLPRVAQIKIGAARFARFREEVRAEPGQQVGMVEFLHPRVEEFCGALPAALGRRLQNSTLASRFIGLFARPRNIRTNSVHGFLAFYLLAKLRRFRRSSLIFQIEQSHIQQWLGAVLDAGSRDSGLALELARCGRLIKGYGSTRERGLGNLQRILALRDRPLSAEAVAALRTAALADEQGEALDQAIAAVREEASASQLAA